MTSRAKYSYSVLRYIHDITTGEFVNIGVVFYSQDASYFNYSIRSTTKRVSDFFPEVRARQFRALIKPVKDGLERLKANLSPSLFKEASGNLDSVLKSVLVRDDSSLVWSPISFGVTSDVEQTFSKIFSRQVERFNIKSSFAGRPDEEIWRNFRRDLEKRNLLRYFEKKTISSHDDEVEFPFAWKNGVWHCIEPISLDLSAADSIKDKAHRYLGQLLSVRDSREEFKVYLVVGRPSLPSLQEAFNKAISILEKIPGDKEIYTEDDSGALAERLLNQIESHFN